MPWSGYSRDGVLARTLASLVLVPAVLVLLYYGPQSAFTAALLIVALAAAAEFSQLVPALATGRRRFWFLVEAGCLVLAAGIGSSASASTRVLVVLALCLIVTGIELVLRGDTPHALPTAATSIFGLVYIPVFLSLMIPVRFSTESGGGPGAILFLLLVTWAADVGAYIVGRLAGRHKLAPSISPGKTVEGAIAGLLCALCVGLLFPRFVPGPWNWVAAGLLAVTGQAGDLFESMLKRGAGVKDSSRLIPGHGGVLDRIDSLLFCSPVLYMLHVSRGL